MTKLKVAIVGYGFVGKAVKYGFSTDNTEIILIDPKLGSKVQDLERTHVDVTFVCVPTPMADDGSINASIVMDTLDYLLETVTGLVVLKSTVLPDIVGYYDRYENFVYNPEFLTERNADYDFEHPIMHVFGGEDFACEQLEYIYKWYSICKPCPVHYMSPQEASFVKYGINSFLATKVSWFNEYYQLVTSYGHDFGKVVDAIGEDKRVGPSHTNVPGYDGKFGYGGSCFPKDTNALNHFANISLEYMSILERAIEYNNFVREEYELDAREKEQNVRYL